MRKTYMKPMAEIEVYKLDAAIATNCGETVSLGPEAPGHTTCDEFKDAFEVYSLPGNARAAAAGTPFYADGTANCDCYYSSGGGSYFTS